MPAPQHAALSDRDLRLLRLRSQLLLPGAEAPSVAKAATGVLALQAQDVAAASISLRARTTGLTAEAARKQATRKAVCRAWLMRNTIFLFATSDLAWMRPVLSERPLVPAMRRLAQEGVGPAKVEEVLDHLRDRLANGPLPRADALAAIRSLGIDPGENNQRTYWLVHVAVLRGVFVVRPGLDRKQFFVTAPPDKPLEREAGFGRLARRYLKAYGPATIEDFAHFFKITKADARLGWEHRGRTIEVATERGPMTALPGGADPPSVHGPVVRLLGIWDHFLLAWEDRTVALPKSPDATHANQPSGYPTAFADGEAVGTWRIERGKASIAIEVTPFDRLPRGIRPALEAEVADIGRFLETEAKLRLASR